MSTSTSAAAKPHTIARRRAPTLSGSRKLIRASCGGDEREDHRHDRDDRHRHDAAQRDDLAVDATRGGLLADGGLVRRRPRGKPHALAFT